MLHCGPALGSASHLNNFRSLGQLVGVRENRGLVSRLSPSITMISFVIKIFIRSSHFIYIFLVGTAKFEAAVNYTLFNFNTKEGGYR